MLTEAIFQLVTTDSTFSSLAGTRLYPILLPDTFVLPASTYQVISSISNPTLATSGMQKTRLQFDCFAETYLAASQLREALITILNGYQGITNGIYFSNISKISHSDYFDHDSLLYRCMVEFYALTNLP